MRIFISVIILIFSFQSWIKADDISDFEIEGMSIGDSALDYLSKKKINKLLNTYYPNSKKFYLREGGSSEYEIYDSVQFAFKNNDKTYKIYGLSGNIFYKTNIKECLKKMNEIEKELNTIFNEAEIIKYGIREHAQDKSGESKQLAQTQYLFSTGGVISIDCTDWSDKFTSKYGYIDNLAITLYSKEYEDFVRYEAF